MKVIVTNRAALLLFVGSIVIFLCFLLLLVFTAYKFHYIINKYTGILV